MAEDSNEFYWETFFVKVCDYFSAQIEHWLIAYTLLSMYV